MNPGAERISGTVESVLFRNDNTGYTVLSVSPVAENAMDKRRVTIVGRCATVWEGEEVNAVGVWQDNPRFGRQFRADSLTCVAPTSAEGILRYLAGGLIKGIGKVKAKKIVDRFGSDTVDVMEHHPERLREIDGFGIKTCERIRKAWSEQRHSHETMIYLQTQGIGSGMAARIWRRYGPDAIAIMQRNPYRLAEEVRGIGFLTADRIALRMGIAKESEIRAEAGLLHCLSVAAEETGHIYLQRTELLLMANEMLGIPVEPLDAALEKDAQRGVVTIEDERVYLAAHYADEIVIARRIATLMKTNPAFKPIQAAKAVEWAEKQMGLTLAAAQSVALMTAVSNKVSVITGGPGVGKTTIIRALGAIFTRRGLKLSLAAPTGRAAKRMTESTDFPATTIHRLLKYRPQTGGFLYGFDNRMEGDVFIIDEASMLDAWLTRKFVEALPDQAVLVLVGDTDQLPSVGAGNVLGDLIASEVIPCGRLTAIFRQDSSGYIVRNAHHINRGEGFELPEPGRDSDFYYIRSNEPHKLTHALMAMLTERIPRKFGLDPLHDVQVLTPMRRGELGTDALNRMIQQRMNPTGPALTRGETAFRRHDRVMQISNDYDKDVYNGDIGFVLTVDTENDEMVVDFDGIPVTYKHEELDELVLAYATSIHKSQGSEYPAVLILIHTQHFKLLRKNLLYTAVTRGKKLVLVFGSDKALHITLNAEADRVRQTTLAMRIKNAVITGELPKLPAESNPEAES